jgi:hypothetical protein
MGQLREIWRGLAISMGLPAQRLIEYVLIAAYAGVAILALIVGFTAKAGTLFGRAVESPNSINVQGLRPILKQLMVAGADFAAGASLLVLGATIVYWNQRRAARRESLDRVVPSGPPFLL